MELTITSTSLPTSFTPLVSGTAILFRTCLVVAIELPFGIGYSEVAK